MSGGRVSPSHLSLRHSSVSWKSEVTALVEGRDTAFLVTRLRGDELPTDQVTAQVGDWTVVCPPEPLQPTLPKIFFQRPPKHGVEVAVMTGPLRERFMRLVAKQVVSVGVDVR